MKVINQIVKDKYSIYHGDSVEVIQGIPEWTINLKSFEINVLNDEQQEEVIMNYKLEKFWN